MGLLQRPEAQLEMTWGLVAVLECPLLVDDGSKHKVGSERSQCLDMSSTSLLVARRMGTKTSACSYFVRVQGHVVFESGDPVFVCGVGVT